MHYMNYWLIACILPVAVDESGTVDNVIFSGSGSLSSLLSTRQACADLPSITIAGSTNKTALGPERK